MVSATESVAVHVFRFARHAAGLAACVAGTVIGSRYTRLRGLRAASEIALVSGELAHAERLAKELIELAGEYPSDWYYGNAIHHGHTVLGLIQMKRGDFPGAEQQLLRAGATPGSPQLNSFGPNLTLARDLLLNERREAVLEYLELCRVFWYPDSRRASTAVKVGGWVEQIKRGEVPDFGAHLVY